LDGILRVNSLRDWDKVTKFWASNAHKDNGGRILHTVKSSYVQLPLWQNT